MDSFIGQLMLVGFNFAPQGWAKCDGQLLSIAQNTALFSLLGTIYGGNGETTFGLPDLRGRVPVNSGTGPGLPNFPIGSKSGTTTNTLNVVNLPANIPGSVKVSSANSTLSVASAGSSIASPGISNGRTFEPTQGFNTSTPDVTLNNQSVSVGGSGQAVNNLQPYLAMTWIIALTGLYPSN